MEVEGDESPGEEVGSEAEKGVVKGLGALFADLYYMEGADGGLAGGFLWASWGVSGLRTLRRY